MIKTEMNNLQLNEKQLIDCISKCNNNSEISDFLNKNLISIEKLEPPFGELRSEHLIKALTIAKFFNTNELISEVPLLQKFYSAIAKNIQSNRNFNQRSYIEFYKSQFSDLRISESNWKRVLNKISLETFIGIDKICEKAIILWNSLSGFKTTNSCSGHYDSNRYFSFSNFDFQFNLNGINISKVSKLLKSAFSNFDSDFFKIDIEINNNQLGINFFQIPPKKWINEHNKIPIIELCNKIFVQFKATFNTNENFENFDTQKYNSTIEAVEFVRRNLWKYINQMNVNLQISDSEDDSFWNIFRARCLIFEETYKDYYISEKAINNVTLFWKKIENVGIDLQ